MMLRTLLAWSVCWLALAACGGVPIPGREAEPDSAVPEPPLPPTAAEANSGDAAAREPDAGPAADGGMPAPMVPMAPMTPVTPEPQPEPPPELPLTVRFEPAGGGFVAPHELRLTAADPAAEVRYTLDGSVPTTASTLATAPLTLERTTLVRAAAVRGNELGPVATHAYFRVDSAVSAFRSDLPVIVIDMQGKPAPDPNVTEHVDALLAAFEPSAGQGETQLEAAASLTSRIGIKVRGRSTRSQEKRSFTLELRGVADEEAPAPLLGLPSHADWVLYAPYSTDPSLMHNAFGYALSRSIGRYAPRTRFCEVFVVSSTDGATQASYAGIYVLTERISRGKERVAVQKLNPADIAAPAVTGGYIFQENEADPGDVPFFANGRRYLFVHPKQQAVVPEQTQYISGYVESMVRAISAADGRDPQTGQHYAALIDVDAFIDHHILNVMIKNPDAFVLSSYFHKERSGLLAAGPLWDLDLALAANDPFGNRSLDPTQWNPGFDSIFARSFWGPLFKHADFEQAYWERWRALLAGPFQVAALQRQVDELASEVMQAEPRNRARWPAMAPRNNDYAAEVAALRAWLQARVEWVTANVGVLP